MLLQMLRLCIVDICHRLNSGIDSRLPAQFAQATQWRVMNSLIHKAPRWLFAVSLMGLAWNIFGAFQFLRTLNASSETLLAQGLSPEQITVMMGLPFWMDIAFGWGVLGGLFGCCLLIARRRIALRVLLSSLHLLPTWSCLLVTSPKACLQHLAHRRWSF